MREYWVVNAQSLATLMHREPAGSSYASVEQVPPAETLVPSLVPALAIRLGELDLA